MYLCCRLLVTDVDVPVECLFSLTFAGSKQAKFADYLDIFDEAAEEIRTRTEIREMDGHIDVFHPLVAGL
jgi:RNAse (barnase) inhibitor barstar